MCLQLRVEVIVCIAHEECLFDPAEIEIPIHARVLTTRLGVLLDWRKTPIILCRAFTFLFQLCITMLRMITFFYGPFCEPSIAMHTQDSWYQLLQTSDHTDVFSYCDRDDNLNTTQTLECSKGKYNAKQKSLLRSHQQPM
jgi:hypothetical protein